MKWIDEGHRIVAVSGSMQVGAVFRPADESQPWRWSMWFGIRYPREGKKPGRLSAQDAVRASFLDMLNKASLEERAA